MVVPALFFILISQALAVSQELPNQRVADLNYGQFVIKEADINDYQAVQGCYEEGPLTSRPAAFLRLLEAGIAEQFMQNQGRSKVGRSELLMESSRIDRETKAPDILSCIKRHFGRDRGRYLALFVRPALIESHFRQFLTQDTKVQARAYHSIRAVQERLKRGESMPAAASGLGLAYSSATYSLAVEREFILSHLVKLQAGEISDKPVESDYDFQLLRLLETDGMRWSFEFLSVPKESQERWFKSQPKMRLLIRDSALRRWIKQIQGNPRLFGVSLLPEE